MDAVQRSSAEQARREIARGAHERSSFRAALMSVPPSARDAWVDHVLGIDELPDDGPALPRGCAPYLPCPVDALLRMLDQAAIEEADVFVDVGAGLGRAAALVHLLTGASAIGIEVQPELARGARALASRLLLDRVACLEGDAATLADPMTIGSVFFLYCTFSGERLERLLDVLERIARTKPIRICCVDLPLPPRPWLARDPACSGDLAIHRSIR